MQEASPFIRGVNTTREQEDAIIFQAKEIIRKRIEGKNDILLTSPQELDDFLIMRIGKLEHEAFGGVFLGVNGNVICVQEVFRGTLTHVPVFTREMAKAALHHNAEAVVVYHNHPSGYPDPSQPDIDCTNTLFQALLSVGVHLLDHRIVGGDKVFSMQAKELMPYQKRKASPPPGLMEFIETLEQMGIRGIPGFVMDR